MQQRIRTWWENTQRIFGLIKWIFSVVITFIGFAGIPNDLTTWGLWMEPYWQAIKLPSPAHWALFLVGIFLLMSNTVPYVFAFLSRRSRQQGEKDKTSSVEEKSPEDLSISPDLTPQISPVPHIHVFVGRLVVEFNHLETDSYIQFPLFVYCCATGLTLEQALSGCVYYAERPANVKHSPSPERIKLDTPQIDRSSIVSLAKGESLIILRQYVSVALRERISAALKNPNVALEFHFEELIVNILSPDSQVIRLPLWAGVVCRHGLLSFYPIITGSVHLVVGNVTGKT